MELLLACLTLAGCIKAYNTPEVSQLAPASHYSSEAMSRGVLVDDDATASALARAAIRGKAGPQPLKEDRRLAELAAILADQLRPSAILPQPDIVEFYGRRAGLPDPIFYAFMIDQGPLSEVSDALTAAISERAAKYSITHFGISPARAYGGSYWLVVLSERRLTFDPLSRKVAVGEGIAFKGTLDAGYKTPVVRVTRAASTENLAAGEGPGFDVNIPTPAQGVLGLEVVAERDGETKLLAVMPVYVGMDPPLEPPPLAAPQGSAARVAEEAILKAIADERSKQQRPTLRVDETLSSLAREHSVSMANSGSVGHVGADGLTPAQRVQRAGLASSLVLENVGRSHDAVELHAEFMKNPGQRNSVLHAKATRVGVGVVVTDNGPNTLYYVTEIFLGETEAVDPATAPTIVLDHINRARAAHGATALQLDDSLSLMAQDGANAYFQAPHPNQQAIVEQVNSELVKLKTPYARAAAVMTVARSLSTAAELELALDRDATHVGIGVARGERPGSQADGIALVIALGWPRK